MQELSQRASNDLLDDTPTALAVSPSGIPMEKAPKVVRAVLLQRWAGTLGRTG